MGVSMRLNYFELTIMAIQINVPFGGLLTSLNVLQLFFCHGAIGAMIKAGDPPRGRGTEDKFNGRCLLAKGNIRIISLLF
jgi:hypothetical protein